MDFVRAQDKLDEIESRLNSIDKTLAVNTELLGEHIRRTNLLEEAIKPIQAHVISVQSIAKMASWIMGTTGILSTLVYMLFKKYL